MAQRIKIQFLAKHISLNTYVDYLKLVRYFEVNGASFTGSNTEADAILFLTWSATGNAEKKERARIRDLRPFRDKIIIAGNLPKSNPGFFEEEYRGRLLPTTEFNGIDPFFPAFVRPFSSIPEINAEDELTVLPHLLAELEAAKYEALLFPFRQKVAIVGAALGRRIQSLYTPSSAHRRRRPPFYIRINTGCAGACSFCSIRRAMGPLQSKPVNTCLEEFEKGLKKGYRHYRLVSNDAGAYGLDNGSSLAVLLNRLWQQAAPADITIDCSSINPQWLLRYNAEIASLIDRGRMTSLHCALQSGSSRILRLMNRFYDGNEVKEALKNYKRIRPALWLRTEIIAGFPSETDEDFRQTLSFLAETGVNEVLFYAFTGKDATEAAGLAVCPDTVVRKRVRQLARFCRQNRIRYHYGY